MSGYFFQFDPEKALHVILWFSNRLSNPDYHNISKLLYLADKEHLAKYGRLICGDQYIAMKHGPVPSGVYDMLKAVRGDGWSTHKDTLKDSFSVEGKSQVIPLKEADISVFSDSDLECLENTFVKYGHMGFQELTVLTHDEAYDRVDENDVMDIEDIIVTLPNGAELLDHLRKEV